MTASARLTGLNTVVRWTKTGGSVVTITGDQTKFSLKRKGDTVDATAGNETSRYPVPTIESAEFSLTIFDASQSFKSLILPLTTGLLEILPTGVGSGKPITSFNAVIDEYSEDFPFDKMLEITIGGKRQGAMIKEEGTVQ